MIDESKLEQALRAAQSAAEMSKEFKSETYHAVLLVNLWLIPEQKFGTTVPQPPVNPPPQQIVVRKAYAPAEFFALKRWKTDIEKAVLAGFFLEHFSNAQSFNKHDIETCLATAKVPPPKNVPLAILKAVQKGLVMELPERKGGMKAYVLTQSGEQRVTENQP